MIKKSGDLFTTTQKAIGHGVNCQGVMGAGIAKAFYDKFPNNYHQYRGMCNRNLLQPGLIMPFWESGLIIVNLATQDRTGADARYDAVLDSTRNAAEWLMNCGVDRLAIPLIGCGIGGLEWPKVETVLLAVEVLYPGFEFEVWKY